MHCGAAHFRDRTHTAELSCTQAIRSWSPTRGRTCFQKGTRTTAGVTNRCFWLKLNSLKNARPLHSPCHRNKTNVQLASRLRCTVPYPASYSIHHTPYAVFIDPVSTSHRPPCAAPASTWYFAYRPSGPLIDPWFHVVNHVSSMVLVFLSFLPFLALPIEGAK